MTKRLLLSIMLLLNISAAAQAVDTRAIDLVRNKEVLDSADMKVIDDFVAQAVKELVGEKDFTAVSKTRAVILLRSQSTAAGQAQYSTRFAEAANKYIGQAFNDAASAPTEEQQVLIVANLLILVGELESPQLADLALGKFDDPKPAIRYLAVLAVTNESFRAKLKEAQLRELIDKIADKLGVVVEKDSPEILALAAEFAAAAQTNKGEELLLKIADRRIAQYIAWKVDYELLDAKILRLLCDTVATPGTDQAQVSRRFAQLFSCVIQRYIKGQATLSDERKQQLMSVLVETETSCLEKMTGEQLTIRTAIEKNDLDALQKEHDRLLGADAKAGAIAAKYKFDYGQNQDGSKRTAPPVLPPPASQTAENR